VLIGYTEVKMLALATSVFDTFRHLRQYALDPHDFWMHAWGTAKAAANLAKELQLNCAPQTCFTAGLLHDMGKYALAAVLERTYKIVLAEARDHNSLVQDAELRILNTNHAEVGAWLAEQWSFPETLRKPIADLYVCRSDGACSPETYILALADQLSRIAEYGTAGDPIEDPPTQNVLNALHISENTIRQHIEKLKNFRAQAENLLDVLTGE